MPSFLEIEGYVFDTEALKDAYIAVPPSSHASSVEYDERALATLLRYFADWSPARIESLNVSPPDDLARLTTDQKRELYNKLVSQLTENLKEQYSREASEAKFEQFLHGLATDPVPDALATFCLQYLWDVSKRLHRYKRGLTVEADDEQAAERGSSSAAGDFVAAIHRLPGEYLDHKHNQYEGDDKINRIRFQALQRIRETGSLSLDTLRTYQQEENTRHETDIMRAYDEFTVLGHLYYDYFKPRIDAYLEVVTTALTERLDLEQSVSHRVNFAEPRNRLNVKTWFAIYPEEAGDKSRAYQLYTGINWDRVRCGLYAGEDVREDGWKEDVDIDTVRETDSLTIDRLADKFDSVIHDYYRLNDLGDSAPERPPQDLLETVERQLETANQVVFYGPPGTGKTFEAQRFANWWVHEQTDGKPRDEQVQSVTFHPSFSYEDFVEGLTAEATESGDVEYHVEDGILKRVAEEARRAYDQSSFTDEPAENPDHQEAPPYVLVVDEINRGNLAQIFGETITLLEADKRGSYEVSLAHSDESFTLPPNLYLVGTMNTADRSIALVDAALRRRFRFVPFPPRPDVVCEQYDLPVDDTESFTRSSEDAFETLVGLSVLALERLNENVTQAPDLTKGNQIGHSYLLGLESTDDIVDAWKYDVFPLLEEYYFGQFERIRRHLLEGAGDELVDWEGERIRDFDDAALASFLESFVDADAAYEGTVTGGSDSRRQSPKYPEFLSSIGERVVDEVGDVLRVSDLDSAHMHDDFKRLSLSLESNHPSHPAGDQLMYQLQVKVHRDIGIEVGVAADEPVRQQIDFESVLAEAGLDGAFEVADRRFNTVTANWETDVSDPYELDGEELREAIGEPVLEAALDEYVRLIEELHPVLVERDLGAPVEENA